MLNCDKCGARGFITVEGDEFHCCLCGFVWYPGRKGQPEKKKPGTRARALLPAGEYQRKRGSKEGTWPEAE